MATETLNNALIDVSFVILTWNSERYIETCLQLLLRDSEESAYAAEMFVVDNGSSDTTVALLQRFQAEHPDRIFPILLDHNTGTTYSRNLALKQTRGRYICVMDSDIEITPGAISALLNTLQTHDRVGLVVPKLLYPNGNLQKSTDMFPTISRKVYRYFFLKRLEQREHAHYARERQNTALHEVDYAISAVWMLKRSVLEQVGLLDERIFYAPEDTDYCLRIWKAGFSIACDPNVTCVHHTQEISRGLRINKALFSHIKGLAYYFWKHKYCLTPPTFATQL